MLNDTLGNNNLVVVTSPGGAAWAYQRGQHQFILAEAGADGITSLSDQQGREWRAEEDALVLVEDTTQSLERLPGHMAYWFGWFAFNQDTEVYAGVPQPSS